MKYCKEKINMKNIFYNIKFYRIISLVLVFMLSSCNYEEDSILSKGKDSDCLYATIENNIITSSRALLDSQDGWSIVSFTQNDVIGLYAKTGNMDGGGFSNAPMMFSRVVNGTFQFDNPDLNMDRSKFQANATMFYYPYVADIEANGIILRSDENGINRCKDILMMENLNSNDLNNKLQLSGNFHHLFSELIIVRGEGFENATNKDIWVVLNEGFTRLKFIDNPSTNGAEVRNMWKIPSLYFDERDGLSQEECRKWQAWEGKAFEPYEGAGAKEAYYVMLPNLYEYRISGQNTLITHPVVDYIQIYDNNGELQTISSFTLNGDTKQIKNSVRYPIEIKMEGLVPTIYPYAILPWEEPDNITDERTVGINNENDFLEWLKIYNQYTSNQNSGSDYDEQLKLYGDQHINESTKEVTWYFYILNDLNFLKINENVRISKLTDVIDGLGNKISNLSLTDSFIEEISDNGRIANLTMRGLTVNNSSKTGNDGIGALTNNLSGNGAIINCDVDATLKANCKVGLLAGSASGGTVDGCIFSGLLIGSGTSSRPYRNLIGRNTPDGTIDLIDTDFSGIIFSEIN